MSRAAATEDHRKTRGTSINTINTVVVGQMSPRYEGAVRNGTMFITCQKLVKSLDMSGPSGLPTHGVSSPPLGLFS